MFRRRSEDNFGDVGRFHAKFGLPNVNDDDASPKQVDGELMAFRIKFLLEELMEFCQGAGIQLMYDDEHQTFRMGTPEGAVRDHAQMFDALIDLVYVALGTAHLLGYPWQEGWDRVQAANMSKVRAQADGSDSKRGSSYDVVKPPGWRPPDIESLLQAYGFNINEEIQ